MSFKKGSSKKECPNSKQKIHNKEDSLKIGPLKHQFLKYNFKENGLKVLSLGRRS